MKKIKETNRRGEPLLLSIFCGENGEVKRDFIGNENEEQWNLWKIIRRDRE